MAREAGNDGAGISKQHAVAAQGRLIQPDGRCDTLLKVSDGVRRTRVHNVL